jgi:hypothetical protein
MRKAASTACRFSYLPTEKNAVLNEYEGGIAISDGADAMPSDVDVDMLLAGGNPNQERIPLDPEVEQGTEIHEGGVAAKPEVTDPNQKQLEDAPKAQALDPIVQKLQLELAKLTPEQRAHLTAPQAAEITYNGEKYSVAPEQQVPLMQMGLNYSQKMRALNLEKQAFEKAKGQVSQHERYYGEIDRVAKAHPDWWQHVQASYQKRLLEKSGQPTSGHDGSEMNPRERDLLAKVSDLEGKLNGFLEKTTQELTQKQHEAEDHALEQEIQSFAKNHSEFDWLTADENTGLVLADRIIAHAHKNGINNFRAAARDYLHDDLVARRELKAKESIGDAIKAKTKAGIVTTKKPSGLKSPKNLASKDYSDLFREGYGELG